MALTLAQFEELCLRQAEEIHAGEVSRERLIDAATSLLLIVGRLEGVMAGYRVAGLEDDVAGHSAAALEVNQDGADTALRDARALLRSISTKKQDITDANVHARVMRANRDVVRALDWLKGMQSYQPLRDILRRYDRGGRLYPSMH